MNNVIAQMLDLLDVQLRHCIDAGATYSTGFCTQLTGGDGDQNKYYSGNRNMACALVAEIAPDNWITVDAFGRHHIKKW